MSKWIRIMSDYGADGVWDEEGLPYSLDDLPVPLGLVARIRDWQAWYDQDCTDYLPHNTLDVPSFSQEGLAIAQAVKTALPEWTVVYFDEAKAKEYSNLNRGKPIPPADRHYFEYVVLLTEPDA